MHSPGPRSTLLLLLGLAAVIFGGGVWLARRSETVRVDREREPFRQFSADAQAELGRLDELYEGHLARLARTLSNDPFVIRSEAERVVGVRQISLLHHGAAFAAADAHIQTAPISGERTPVPAFTAPHAGAASAFVLLDEARFFGDEAVLSGWIDAPGKPLMFWLRRSSNEVAIMMVDRKAVETAESGWLEAWAATGMEPIRAAGGPDQLRDRDGRALAAVGETPEGRADLVAPLRSRVGAWEAASWDRRQTRVHYAAGALAASGVMAALVALLGVIVYGQQCGASARAAQRVSFVNRVSHELRSPLTNILLNLDLAHEALEETPAEAARRLALVQEEARRLGRLIDNVLTFSRSEQGRLRVEPRACAPEGVIGAVVEQFAASFARRALTVRRDGEIGGAFLLDADALAQIMSNLLSNVEKYVPGGVVVIAGRRAEGSMTITVADEGPGIPAEAAERIFLPFERLHARVNEGASGAGLGLAIARDLAASMGGSLRLAPSERGACFELRLPAIAISAICAA